MNHELGATDATIIANTVRLIPKQKQNQPKILISHSPHFLSLLLFLLVTFYYFFQTIKDRFNSFDVHTYKIS